MVVVVTAWEPQSPISTRYRTASAFAPTLTPGTRSGTRRSTTPRKRSGKRRRRKRSSRHAGTSTPIDVGSAGRWSTWPSDCRRTSWPRFASGFRRANCSWEWCSTQRIQIQIFTRDQLILSKTRPAKHPCSD